MDVFWWNLGVIYRTRFTGSGKWWIIGLVEEGDIVDINIPNREINLRVDEKTLAARREAQLARGDKAWTPKDRQRQVSFALRAYASLATSADKGAVRDKSKLGG